MYQVGGTELSWTAGRGGSELYELGGPAELAVDVDWAMRPKSANSMGEC